jgi:hypothetical protein
LIFGRRKRLRADRKQALQGKPALAISSNALSVVCWILMLGPASFTLEGADRLMTGPRAAACDLLG